MAKIVIEINEKIFADELHTIKQLLRDALGEFQATRGYYCHSGDRVPGVKDYVKRRHSYLTEIATDFKIREVLARCELAHKINCGDITLELPEEDGYED